jgi:hypothetical protein
MEDDLYISKKIISGTCRCGLDATVLCVTCGKLCFQCNATCHDQSAPHQVFIQDRIIGMKEHAEFNTELIPDGDIDCSGN